LVSKVYSGTQQFSGTVWKEAFQEW